MAKKKIAILGGGIAGLTTAYELTKTQDLRDQHEVTVYQMGWRLGGKVASGRDEHGRNREHGLHVWFGCYENVFRMTREIYGEWQGPPDSPLKRVEDVAKPQVYTPVGVKYNDEFLYFPLNWPLHPGVPGDGHEVDWTPREALEAISDLFIRVMRDTAADHIKLRANGAILDAWPAQLRAAARLPERFAAIIADSLLSAEERDRGTTLWERSQTTPLSFGQNAEAAHLLTRALLSVPDMPDRDAAQHVYELYERALAQFTAVAQGSVGRRATGPTDVPLDLKFVLVWELLAIMGAMTRGYLADLIWPDQPFESLDELDLRDWLKRHGADVEIVDRSSVLRALYDTMFQFRDGNAEKPSYAAGTALGVIARLIVTYKSAMMWEVQAGMGEALIAPLYEVLEARGVSFRFFHKVQKLVLSSDGSSIDRIELKRQAKVKQGADYKPVKSHAIDIDGEPHHLVCWPHEPDWDQLENGAALKAAGVDFECHWADADGEPLTLQREADFDTVVLAISLGGYKPLNAIDGSMCADLIARGGAFADFAKGIELVPSQSLQLWCDKTTAEMGWTSGKAATVSGPEYLDIWADMTQVIRLEGFAPQNRPKSLHYLCGTFDSEMYKEPSTNRAVPGKVRDDVRKQQIAWLNTHGQALWPKARKAGSFDFGILNDPTNATGVKRFDAQHFRANVSPHECCALTTAGSTKFRLLAHESGVDNLILAGEATRHGFNTTTIEGATMSGMAASRAICGSPLAIPGYDFLRRRPSDRALEVTSAKSAVTRPYTSWIGHGAASMAQPGRFTDATAYAFVLQGNRQAMQSMVDTFLNANTDGSVSYQVPPLPPALVTFVDVKQCTSVVDAIGWVPGRETAFWIPLLETRRGHLLPRPVLWAPYIFISYTIGMLTGREVWGWPKSLAEIAISAAPGTPSTFACSTMTFDRFAPTTPGKVRKLYAISGTAPFPVRSGFGARAVSVAAEAANLFNSAWARMLGGSALPTVAAIALKQVRDSRDANLACFQAIVDSPVRVTRMGGGGLLPGNFTLSINTCDSHQIVRDLFGRAPDPTTTHLPVRFAAWTSLDFDALPGDVIYQATRS